jgi:hypothetical protein
MQIFMPNSFGMKKIVILLLVFFPFISFSQNVGIGTTTPHPNAMLEIKGNNKGILIPRGDAATRTALNTNAAKGLLLCDTVTNTIWIHNGNGLASGWNSLSSGTNYWIQQGALGTEIKNTNAGGFWSPNSVTLNFEPGSIPPPVSGGGTRFLWMPGKSALRAGTVDGNEWNADSIGTWSTAIGYNAKAKGAAAIALGTNTEASNYTSVALGYGTKASGFISTAMGENTAASGNSSTSMGIGTNAKAYSSLSIGRYNDSIASSNISSWVSTDPLFQIGNGSDLSNRHNAMVVYKNGNMVLKNPTTVLTDPVGFTVPVSGAGTRMMWLPEKSAFRAGTVEDIYWDTDSIGTWSTALGYNTKAKGNSSTAFGAFTKADGLRSTAMGGFTIASNFYSTATGYTTFASGFASTTMGQNTQASGTNSTAIGGFTTASGLASASTGLYTSASGTSSFSMGDHTIASGSSATSLGYYNVTKAFSSVVMGRYNDSINTSNSLFWIANDPLLILGNGTADNARHNAMVVYKNGNMVLKNPTAVTSNPIGLTIPVSGSGTRMMWLPEKSAFRAGTVDASEWDADSIGAWSFATGRSVKAKGIYSSAMGFETIASSSYTTALGFRSVASGLRATAIGDLVEASGEVSFATGSNTVASNLYATAMGSNTNAKGISSMAMGSLTTASGDYATTNGYSTYSKAYASLAIGRFNDSVTTSNNTSWISTDPLFYIGNGTDILNRHNAMVIYKNGNMVLKNPTEVTTDPVGFTVPVSASGTRMMWLPEKSAFRAGTAGGADWNADSIGTWSFATGRNTRAVGSLSFASGRSTKAYGISSVAFNSEGIVRGTDAAVFGTQNIAQAVSSLVMGVFNDTIAGVNPVVSGPTDPLFIIGNGTATNTRSNALVVFKNGNTDISGYTQLGKTSEAAPAIKMKKLTGTSAATQGTLVTIPHGLTRSKILGVQVLLTYAANTADIPGSYLDVAGYEYNWQITNTDINIYTKAGNSANILSKPLRILITYEE